MKDDTISRAAALNCVYGTSPNRIKGRIAELPSATDTNVGGNLIDRQAALDAIKKLEKPAQTAQHLSAIFDCEDTIKALPSAEPDIPGINVIIDTIKNAINASTGNEAYMVGLRNGMRWCLSALTDKEPEYEDMLPTQPGWIPTSERLPDNDRAVLVTLKWAEDDYEVAVGEYWHNSTASHGWGSFEGHVIAWHELPTPYREGGQDE